MRERPLSPFQIAALEGAKRAGGMLLRRRDGWAETEHGMRKHLFHVVHSLEDRGFFERMPDGRHVHLTMAGEAMLQ